ncbi:hypothetical protein [Aromatoleum toluvorans]|nr:hypothetical protein [Aromatoleum toluvorans]
MMRQPAATAERLALQAEKDLRELQHSLARAQAVKEIAPGLSSRY